MPTGNLVRGLYIEDLGVGLVVSEALRTVYFVLFTALGSGLRSQAALQIENAALRPINGPSCSDRLEDDRTNASPRSRELVAQRARARADLRFGVKQT